MTPATTMIAPRTDETVTWNSFDVDIGFGSAIQKD
jgi:hypothetical protein